MRRLSSGFEPWNGGTVCLDEFYIGPPNLLSKKIPEKAKMGLQEESLPSHPSLELHQNITWNLPLGMGV